MIALRRLASFVVVLAAIIAATNIWTTTSLSHRGQPGTLAYATSGGSATHFHLLTMLATLGLLWLAVSLWRGRRWGF